MPTVDPASRPQQPHTARNIAESFGVDPQLYDRARPRYPDELIAYLLERIGANATVLDVGCGAGIASRQLRDAGCTVHGVEPDDRMAAYARDTGIPVTTTTFEEYPADGDTFDAVVASMAWHWVDPVAGAERAARLLRPGGLFCAFWNVAEMPLWFAEAYADAFHAAVPDSPFDNRAVVGVNGDSYQPILDKAAAGLDEAGGFGPTQRWRHDWPQTYTRTEWLETLRTHGMLTRVTGEPLTRILSAAGDTIDAHGGSITVTYATLALAALRDG